MSPNSVVRFDHHTLDVELDQPFTIAGGTHEGARLVVVELELADGTVGLGEAAPLPAYNGETVEQVRTALGAVRDTVLGLDVRHWRRACAAVHPALADCGAALCALETALLDALCRSRGASLFEWFGGRDEPELEIDVTIPIGSVETAARAARSWAERGFRAFKIKVGGPEDLARVLAVRTAVPGARLLLDANGGLDGTSASELVARLREQDSVPALFEQPVPRGDWDGLGRVRASGVRVALDESICSARDAVEAVDRLGSDVTFNIKLMKAGIVEALDVAAVARAHGVPLMIGGMVESNLAMTVSACFAAGLGGFEFADLDTHLFLQDSPLVGGLALRGAMLDVSGATPGHGVTLSR